MLKCLSKTTPFRVWNTSSIRNLFRTTNFCAETSLQEEVSCIQTKQSTALRGIQKSKIFDESSTNQTTHFSGRWCIDFLILFIFSFSFVSSLGITPALKTIDFFPGLNNNITFTAISENPEEVLDILIGGDLAEYVTTSAQTVTGSSSFVVSLQFPDTVPEPGKHSITVSLREKSSESSFIGTAVEIGAIISVFIPYPGLYGEISLSVPDSNVGERVPIEFHVINRGEQELNLSNVVIDFFTDEKFILHSMNFTPVIISAPGDRYFRKYLEGNVLQSGNYTARARINYEGTIREINSSFKVGSLNVYLVNFTKTLPSGGIHKFYINLRSSWNSLLSGVYVDVNLTNSLNEFYEFRTPSIDIKPWEEQTVISYFDTEKLSGEYNLQLKIVYPGNFSLFSDTITIIPQKSVLIYLIIGGSLIFLILIYFIINNLRKIKLFNRQKDLNYSSRLKKIKK